MTRDELIDDIGKGIKDVIPENKDLEADDITSVETAVEEVLEQAENILINESDDDDEPEEKPKVD